LNQLQTITFLTQAQRLSSTNADFNKFLSQLSGFRFPLMNHRSTRIDLFFHRHRATTSAVCCALLLVLSASCAAQATGLNDLSQSTGSSVGGGFEPSNSTNSGQRNEKLQSPEQAENRREWEQLSKAVSKAQSETDGRALSVRKIRNRSGLSYRIKVLTRTGRVRVVQIAADSEIESSETK
jgi:hypothetical protein